MPDAITFRIETIDGEIHDFAIVPTSHESVDYSIGSKLKRFLNEQQISLIVDGELLLIPMHRIKQLRVFPVVGRLPKGVLATATRITSASEETVEDHGHRAAA